VSRALGRRVGRYDGYRDEGGALTREDELDEAQARRREQEDGVAPGHGLEETASHAFSWEYVKAVVHSDVPVRRSSSAQMKAGLEPNACCLAHTGRYWSTTGCSGPCASSDVLQKRLCIYTPGSQGSLLAEYVTCTLTPLVAWGLDASSNTSTHIKSGIETTGIFLIS
jgi:hypothetical protein